MFGFEDHKKHSEDEVKDFIIRQFADDEEERSYLRDRMSEIDILVAHLYDDYSSDCYYLIRDKKTNKLFDVEGGHCSCYGYEGQWDEVEVLPEALLHRKDFRSDGIKEAINQLFLSLDVTDTL